MWNSFTDLEKSNFGSLNAFNKSLERANLNQFLTVYRFPVVCIVHSCCICVLTVGVNLSLDSIASGKSLCYLLARILAMATAFPYLS